MLEGKPDADLLCYETFLKIWLYFSLLIKEEKSLTLENFTVYYMGTFYKM